MTRYCPHCYVGIDPEDAVCKNCGEALNPEPTPPRSSEAEDASFEAVPGDTAVGELTPESKEGPSPEAPDENAAGEGEGTYRPANAFERDTPPEAPRTAASDRSPSDPDKDTSVISLGEWMWSLLLTFIPLVNIIALIIWSISDETNPSKKNFARARLIYVGIGIVFWIVVIVLFVIGIATFAFTGTGAGYYPY